jgi:queuosine precursor transporter
LEQNTAALIPKSRKYKYYDLIMAAFVTVLLCSNVIGAEKVVSLLGSSFGAGILFFPISYFFNDVLTEVYGYSRSRKVVWAGFTALIFASIMSAVVVGLPPAPGSIQLFFIPSLLTAFGQMISL